APIALRAAANFRLPGWCQCPAFLGLWKRWFGLCTIQCLRQDDPSLRLRSSPHRSSLVDEAIVTVSNGAAPAIRSRHPEDRAAACWHRTTARFPWTEEGPPCADRPDASARLPRTRFARRRRPPGRR